METTGSSPCETTVATTTPDRTWFIGTSRKIARHYWGGAPGDPTPFLSDQVLFGLEWNGVHLFTVDHLDGPFSDTVCNSSECLLVNDEYTVSPLGDGMHLVTMSGTARASVNTCGVPSAQVSICMLWLTTPEGPRLKLCEAFVNDLPASPRLGGDLRNTQHVPSAPALAITNRSTQPLSLQASDTKGTTHWVAPAQIVYVSAAHQYTNVHCVDRTIRVRAAFGMVLEQLAGTVVRVHRSYAVNPIYVSRLAGEMLYLVNGAKLPVPAKRVKEVRLMLAQYCEKLGTR